MTDTDLYREISSLSDDMKQKVQLFITSLKKEQEISTTRKQRRFGAAKGFFTMRDDFDAPLEEFKEYM